MTTRHVTWAKSPEESAELQALGWTLGQNEAPMHHNFWALLLVWEGDGEPPMPERGEVVE